MSAVEPPAPAGGPGSQPGWQVRPLTPREREVLDLMAAGLTNEEIGARLHIRMGTVKRHITNIFHKITVKTRVQVIMQVGRSGPGNGFSQR